jgi:hypothetical protein
MGIKEIKSGADEFDYEKFILGFPISMFNASLKFREFLSLLLPKECEPHYLIAEENGCIVGALPAYVAKSPYGNVLNSMPWFGSNPGIMATNARIKGALFSYFFNQMVEKYSCISATLISPPWYDQFYDSIEKTFSPDEYFISERIGMRTPIPEWKDDKKFHEDFMGMIDGKARNQVKNALRDCSIIDGKDKSDFLSLAKIHRENMGALGAPIKDKEFDILRKKYIRGEDYQLYLSEVGGDLAAGLLMKYFNQTVDYMTPAVVASLRKRNPLHILIYQAFKDASQRGFKWWNWGGSLTEGMDGVVHFKKQFGAQQSIYKYYTKLYDFDLPFNLTKKNCLKNWPYFFVIPFQFLEGDE